MNIIDVYLDTETTGLCGVTKGTELPGKHDVIQVAAIIEASDDGGMNSTFEAKCQPINWSDIAQQALDVHGYQIADLRTFPESGVVCVEFRTFLANHKIGIGDKFRIIAHNMPFDYKFLRSWFVKNGFGDWDSFFLPQDQCLCTQKLGNAAKKAGKLPSIENMKLITAAKYIGFRFDAHDALGDTLACRAFHKFLTNTPECREQAEGKEPMDTDEVEDGPTGSMVL